MEPERLQALSSAFDKCADFAGGHKTCNKCGRRYTEQTFDQLPYVGLQEFPPAFDGDTEMPVFEMRNCPCGSTLVKLIAGSLE